MKGDKFGRIRCISASGQKVQNLAHLIDKNMLLDCFEELDSNKAVGSDGVTKEEYGQNLHRNLDRLISRMKAGVYFPKPSKRVYIPKPGSKKMRPLGISCFEDKIVERAINKILVEVYEPKFLDCSYGFRQGRSCHLAVSELLSRISGLTSYIVEADIRNCFGSFDHDQLIRFLEHDIADKKFLELIKRGLKAGHLEGNIWYSDETGTMQGCGYSPTLANVYMHYTLDTWFRYKTRSVCDLKDRFRGKASLIRYADDFVCCFQYESDARKFFTDLKVRLEKYGLSMAEEKTRVLEFGRFAAQNIRNRWKRTKEGPKRPETFDFLGFQFYCGKAKGSGRFCPKVRSVSKRVRSKINKIGEWIRMNRHCSLKFIFRHVNTVLRGYFNYYAVTCNSKCVVSFRYEIIRLLFKWLNRRSQRRSYSWTGFNQMMRNRLVDAHIRVNIYTYRTKRLTEEPCA